MIRKALVAGGVLAVAMAIVAGGLYRWNATPVHRAISSAEAAGPGKPYVIKLHAQWCPVCMLTKGMWTAIDAEYGSRVNLVVFDFTSEGTTAASRSEATRLGLGAVFDEHDGWTGTVLVVDGRSKIVLDTLHGNRDIADYRAAIDAALISRQK